MNNTHTIQEYPAFRKLGIDIAAMAMKNHMIHGCTELDITQTRKSLKEWKKTKGRSPSLTAFLIGCIGRAVAQNPRMHGYRKGGKLFLFEDVDIMLPVEMTVGEHKHPVIHIFRSINTRSYSHIDEELKQVQHSGLSDMSARKNWKRIQLFLKLPRWVRRPLFAVVLRNPFLHKKYMGTVAVTALSMFGSGGGWGVGLSNHTLEVIIGGISQKPRLIDGALQNRDILPLTLCVDHDIIDGGPAARFVKQLRKQIERGITGDHPPIEKK